MTELYLDAGDRRADNPRWRSGGRPDRQVEVAVADAVGDGPTSIRPGTILAPFHWHRVALAGVLMAYLAIAATYNLNTPVFEAPDEIWHYLYVRHLSEGKGLPHDDGRDSGSLNQQEAAQPPLYYAVAAALTFWAPRGDIASLARANVAGSRGDPTTDGNKNVYLHAQSEQFPWQAEVLTIHLVRFTTTMWGALAVLFTYLTGRMLFRSAALAVAAAAVVAFTPEFLFMSSAVSNDVSVAAAGAILLYASTRTARFPPSRLASLLLGLAGGVVILTKPIAGAALVLIPLSIWIGGRQGGEKPRDSVGRLGLAAAGVIVSCGWWFVYNQITYGSLFPVQSFLSRGNLLAEVPTAASFVADLSGLRYSYWAFFGWFSIPVPARYYRYYDFLLVLGVLGCASLVVKWRRRGWEGRKQIDLVGLALPLLLVTTVLGAVFVYRLIVLAFQGRLLLGAVSGLGLLLVAGWAGIVSGRAGRLIGVTLAASLIFPAALFPWTILRPSYQAPPLSVASAIHPLNPISATFSGEIRLLGADVEPSPDARVRAGADVVATVYLQGLRQTSSDYLLFMKVVDSSGRVVAEVNSHPGHGSYPTSKWVLGPVLADRYRIHLPPATRGPSVDRLFFGLYRGDTMTNLPVVASDGTPLGTSIPLGVVVVDGSHATGAATAGQPFSEGSLAIISLVESRVETASRRPGAVVSGTLIFAGLGRPTQDYTIFVHLEQSGKLYAQDDAPPLRGSFPTSYWRPGDTVEHQWSFTIPPDAATGDYRVKMGWYNSQTGVRLVTATGDSIDLGTIHVD